MANEKTKTEQTNAFTNAKNVVALKPKSVAVQAFVYKSLNDLKALISFIGNRPLINPDTSLQFKKMTVKENSVVMRNSYGEVTEVLTFDEAQNKYDIAAEHDFTAADVNKVQDKPVRTRASKA